MRLKRGPPKETLKMTRFQTPARAQKMSSRVDGSAVFHVSQGSILEPILESFWHPLGTHGLHYCRQRASGPPPAGPHWGLHLADSAPPDPLGAAMEACFVSFMASGTP